MIAAGEAGAFDQNHVQWDQVLKGYSHEGFVNYKKLKAEPKILDQYLDSLAGLKESEYKAWKREDQIAFWINAYNALTVKAILDHYPIKSSWAASLRFPKNSIRQIPGVWDKLQFTVIGRKISLNEIEHETLRKQFKEPRAHMALVCASIGCPPLRGEAYTSVGLESQLDDQAKRFLENPAKFKIDKENKRMSMVSGIEVEARQPIFLSPIFKWFGEDFKNAYPAKEGFGDHGTTEKAVLNFISRYVSQQDRPYLLKGNYDIKYLNYDWSLNESK
ncbi:MAG: DUF547 domain-containing protein [Elusimicrobia bacterium]|nr:DUF547 domain-containing protein [Elusimicrobiota bacterium]